LEKAIMSISGLGSAAGVSGLQYDFTKMTNAQLLKATSALYANGSLSQSEAAQLSAKAQGVDNANPTDPQSVALTLSDPTQRNVLGLLQTQYNWVSAHPADTTSAPQLSSLLQSLTEHQIGKAGGSSTASPSTIGGIISTTA
jgi:hypothetical protein